MAQEVVIAGALFSDVPAIKVPDSNDVYHSFVDTSDATATADKILAGYTSYSGGSKVTGTANNSSTITGTYTSNTKTLAISTTGSISTWFGGVDAEFIYEARCTLCPKDAANWPITPSGTAQSLTWTTTYTATANANATFDRYGNGYHSGTALNYGAYNYIWLCSGMVHLAYTVDEATMGMYHVIANAFETVMCYGSRPRVASGSIVYPGTSSYGTYGNTSTATLITYYRTDSNVIALANNATYGVSLAAIAPQQQSTSSVKPTYVNFRYPTVGIRAHDSYMPIAAYNYVDWAKTKVEYRARLYRVPLATGIYYMQNDRMVRTMILGNTFPVEPV